MQTAYRYSGLRLDREWADGIQGGPPYPLISMD
jgi:hypothetical protein